MKKTKPRPLIKRAIGIASRSARRRRTPTDRLVSDLAAIVLVMASQLKVQETQIRELERATSPHRLAGYDPD